MWLRILARTNSGFSAWTLWLAPSTTNSSALGILDAIILEFSVKAELATALL